MKTHANCGVLIVDDEETIRFSLKYLLQKKNYRVTAVPSANQALKELNNNAYEVVLTDIILDGISGVDLLKNIKKKYPKIKVLLMTGYASLNSAIEAVRLGASDYLIKPCSKKTILSAIQSTLKKGNTNDQLAKFDSTNLKVKPRQKPLTKKELEVFEYLFYGLKLEKIADNLNVSLPTIKFHLKNCYRKLGIKGRREIMLVYQNK